MSLRFDESFISHDGYLDLSQLYIQPDEEGGKLCYGKVSEGILLQGEKLQELLIAAANNTKLDDREFAFIARDPEIKKLARDILGLETKEHKAKRSKVFTAFQRAVKRAKKIGKGLFKIQKAGYRGKTLGEEYWGSEIVTPTGRVKMLSETEREECSVVCEEGVFTIGGKPCSTNLNHSAHSGEGYAVFVIGPEKKMHLGNHGMTKDEKYFFHSSFLSDAAVFCAGEIKIDEHGKLVALSNKSGHYKPGDLENLFLLRYLEERGVDLTTVDFSFVGGSSVVKASDYYEILKLFAEDNKPALEKNNALSLMMVGVALEQLQALPKTFRAEVMMNGENVAYLLGRGVTLDQLKSLPEVFRQEVMTNGENVAYLLGRGATLGQLQGLSDAFRAEVWANSWGVAGLLEVGVTLELLALLSPEKRAEIIINFQEWSAFGWGIVSQGHRLIGSLMRRITG
jgi:hypothetical protein